MLTNIENRKEIKENMSKSEYELSTIPIKKIHESTDLFDYNKISEKKLVNDLVDLLFLHGITPSLKGYNFIIDAIRIMYHSGFTHLMITKHIYIPIARLYNDAPQLVEHCIRTAFRSGWSKKTEERLDSRAFYGFTRVPTNYDFLIYLSRILIGKLDIYNTEDE